MPQKTISLQFGFSQDYRREDQLPAPDNFPMYSETSTISKVHIGNSRIIRISKPNFQIYGFRSKLALQNPVTMAMLLANENIEDILADPFEKLVDDKKGKYNIVLPPNTRPPQILSEQIQTTDPYRIAYQEIPEFADFPTNSIENYPLGSFGKLILSGNTNKEIIQCYSLQSDSYQSMDELLVYNTANYEYIYLVPYLLRLARTQVAISGRVSFMLEDVDI